MTNWSINLEFNKTEPIRQDEEPVLKIGSSGDAVGGSSPSGSAIVTILEQAYKINDKGVSKEEAKSIGRRVVREDGTEELEYLEEDDPQEIKVAKKLMGITKPPSLRVFRNKKEVEVGDEYEEDWTIEFLGPTFVDLDDSGE